MEEKPGEEDRPGGKDKLGVGGQEQGVRRISTPEEEENGGRSGKGWSEGRLGKESRKVKLENNLRGATERELDGDFRGWEVFIEDKEDGNDKGGYRERGREGEATREKRNALWEEQGL